MGDRYFVTLVCPSCEQVDEAYYAPTCGFTEWNCTCGHVFDLEAETGITYEDASNRKELEVMIDRMKEGIWPKLN